MSQEITNKVTNLIAELKRLNNSYDELREDYEKHSQINYDCFALVKNAIHHLEEKRDFDYASLKQLQEAVNKSIVFISGVFAGMHYPIAASGLKEIYGLLEGVDNKDEDSRTAT